MAMKFQKIQTWDMRRKEVRTIEKDEGSRRRRNKSGEGIIRFVTSSERSDGLWLQPEYSAVVIKGQRGRGEKSKMGKKKACSLICGRGEGSRKGKPGKQQKGVYTSELRAEVRRRIRHPGCDQKKGHKGRWARHMMDAQTHMSGLTPGSAESAQKKIRDESRGEYAGGGGRQESLLNELLELCGQPRDSREH